MLFCYFKYFFLKFFLFFLIFLLFKQTNSLVCYSCLALNYRQHVLSRNDDLLPPQSRQNLSDLFESLKNNGFSSVEVSSSCADVALTTQPTFLNTPISICNKNDFCVKMDFYYFGEKVVVRNCLSMLMKLSSNVPLFCPVLPEEPSNLIIGNFQNVSICSCQTDLCNSSKSIQFYFLIYFLIFNFSQFL